jgi:peptidoglycan/xylan/chitin deacetylase (PgdA/CDA1 family)
LTILITSYWLGFTLTKRKKQALRFKSVFETLPPLLGARILQEWIDQGFDLGNHTYSHPDINAMSIEQIESEIVAANRRSDFF